MSIEESNTLERKKMCPFRSGIHLLQVSVWVGRTAKVSLPRNTSYLAYTSGWSFKTSSTVTISRAHYKQCVHAAGTNIFANSRGRVKSGINTERSNHHKWTSLLTAVGAAKLSSGSPSSAHFSSSSSSFSSSISSFSSSEDKEPSSCMKQWSTGDLATLLGILVEQKCHFRRKHAKMQCSF